MNTLIQIGHLFKAVDTIEGRKRLQKMVHILQEFGIPFGLQFSYHHYGPYSEDLQTTIQFFSNDGLIKEVPITKGQYPTSCFQAESSLLGLLSDVGENKEPEWSAFAKELKEKSAKQLETISTMLFLGAIKESTLDLKKKFVALKPHLEEFFDEAVQDIQSFKTDYSQFLAVA